MFKKIFYVLFVALLIAAYVGYNKYQAVFKANVPSTLVDPYLYIPSGASYEKIVNLLLDKRMLINEDDFHWVAEKMSYKKSKMRTGRFKIEPGWSNRKLIQHLRAGKQATVKVVLNNERLPEEVAGKVAKELEADSLSLLNKFRDPATLEKYNLNPATLMTLFIPNTYEFFWNQNPDDFMKRMSKEHKKFWSKNDRLKKAEKKGMSPEEVYTLASIVERETLRKDEKRRIAGVYLNRLKTNMLLQADPTVVFATRDFTTRRVLNRHLKVDSPYNTYKYTGLPPGPISMASISSLDAVLDGEDHDYIFFCAKGDGSGYHAFAKTLVGHNQNARRYKLNLKKRGLR